MSEEMKEILVSLNRLASAIERQNELKEVEMGLRKPVEMKEMIQEFVGNDKSKQD